MATKSITITTEAYERLATFKGVKDSFSDVINKITKKHSIMELAGILTEKEATNLSKAVNETREGLEKRLDKTSKKLQ